MSERVLNLNGRTFAVGAVWYSAIAIKMVSRHPGHWTTYPPRNLFVLLAAWVISALVLGVVITTFQSLRSWWGVGLGTMIGSFVVMGSMLLIVEPFHRAPADPEFKSDDEMMAYFANQATTWVRKERGIDLDYSMNSIKVVEEQLARISKEVDKKNPQPGTFGVATGYGAYVGEVFRRRYGGSWSVDHPAAGTRSYPLTITSNSAIFPVGWCWRRIINGEEDNVYLKATMVADHPKATTNGVGEK